MGRPLSSRSAFPPRMRSISRPPNAARGERALGCPDWRAGFGGDSDACLAGQGHVTSAGNDSGITFTITGTSAPSRTQVGRRWKPSPAGTGCGSDNAGLRYSHQRPGIGPTASTITGGTSGLRRACGHHGISTSPDFQVSLVGYITSGTPAWGVEYTYDDVYGLYLPAGTLFPRPIAMATMPLTNTASPLDGFLTSPVRATRLTVNGTGTVQLTSTQQGYGWSAPLILPRSLGPT